MPLAPDLRQALVDGLRRLYGERLRRVVLFGSEARGEATDDSDVDVLVVLAGEVAPFSEAWRLGDLAMDLLIAFGRVVGFVAMAEDHFLHTESPLLINVRREGIPLPTTAEEVEG